MVIQLFFKNIYWVQEVSPWYTNHRGLLFFFFFFFFSFFFFFFFFSLSLEYICSFNGQSYASVIALGGSGKVLDWWVNQEVIRSLSGCR